MKSPETGLDSQDHISLYYRDGRMANMQCSVMCANDRQGMISGTEGYLIVDNINNPTRVEAYNKDHVLTQTFTAPCRVGRTVPDGLRPPQFPFRGEKDVTS